MICTSRQKAAYSVRNKHPKNKNPQFESKYIFLFILLSWMSLSIQTGFSLSKNSLEPSTDESVMNNSVSIQSMVTEIHTCLMHYIQDQTEPVVIAVSEPRDISTGDKHISASRLMEAIESNLIQNRTLYQSSFQLLARSKLQEVLTQLTLQDTDYFNKADYAQIGSMTGATVMLSTMDGISQGTRHTRLSLVELSSGCLIGTSSSFRLDEQTIDAVNHQIRQALSHIAKHNPTLIVLPKNTANQKTLDRLIVARIEHLILKSFYNEVRVISGENMMQAMQLVDEYQNEIYDDTHANTIGQWQAADILVTVELQNEETNPHLMLSLTELKSAQLLGSLLLPLEKSIHKKPTHLSDKDNDSSILHNTWFEHGHAVMAICTGYINQFGSTAAAGLHTKLGVAPIPYFVFGFDLGGYRPFKGLASNANQLLTITPKIRGQFVLHSHSNQLMYLYASMGPQFYMGYHTPTDPIHPENSSRLPIKKAAFMFELGFQARLLDISLRTCSQSSKLDIELNVGFNFLGFLKK